MRISSRTLSSDATRVKHHGIPWKAGVRAAHRSVVNVTQLLGVKMARRAVKIDDPATECSSSRMSHEAQRIEGD